MNKERRINLVNLNNISMNNSYGEERVKELLPKVFESIVGSINEYENINIRGGEVMLSYNSDNIFKYEMSAGYTRISFSENGAGMIDSVRPGDSDYNSPRDLKPFERVIAIWTLEEIAQRKQVEKLERCF